MRATTDQLFLEAVYASMRDGSDAYMNLRRAMQTAGYKPPKNGFAMGANELVARLEYACALWGGVNWQSVLKACRHSEVVRFRAACYVALRESGYSLSNVAILFGKHHASVLHALNAHGHEPDVRKYAVYVKRCLVGPLQPAMAPTNSPNYRVTQRA